MYARARWYDSETGTFLTPDPESYADSSNLYAAFRNDPINNSDPTGRFVPQAAGCVGSALIGWGITELTGGDYTLKDAGSDCALGAATVGLSGLGQLRHLRHASNLTRWGARVGAEAALDVGAEAVRREWKGEDYTWGELATGAAVNAVIGEGGAYIGRAAPYVKRGFGRFVDTYNASIFSSEVGAIGHGVRNRPKSRSTSLRTLAPLTGSFADAFEGPVRERRSGLESAFLDHLKQGSW